ncbi:8-amino-7-oxononanoate synthase [Bacteroides sp.]|uniref:8-amino-7-oxononanoate synthase n=1 Tax=Bacteroides sp. TaxID=29523 RepID=UPI002FCAE0AE
MSAIEQMRQELTLLQQQNNLRSLPALVHEGREVLIDHRRMLNLSSNDYLGLASNEELRREFLQTLTPENFLPASSSSRLLTGNFTAYRRLENELADLFGTEAALTFNCGYHANTGILPVVSNAQTLILADKLIHASLIDGIKLSVAKAIRYRHNDYAQLERLIEENHEKYERIIIVTESIFSMDGDEADLAALVRLKRTYASVLLYVDEAHAFGVRGLRGLGCAEEQGCIADIDFLVGTFGKALASSGAYIVCSQVIREYLINKMRPFIFTTALPPINVEWTLFLLKRLPAWGALRQQLSQISDRLREALKQKGYACPSTSHIIPLIAGASSSTIALADVFQRKGFYVLPVRPPTVPEGTSRLRFSLTAAIEASEIDQLIEIIA